MKTHKIEPVDLELLREFGVYLTTREERDSYRKIVHTRIDDFDLEHFDSRYLPVRESSNYRQRKNKIGYLWMSKFNKLRAFESLLEQTILLDLDRDEEVHRVWTQPFRIEGLDPNRGNRRVYPTPDILVEYTNGELELIEVKPEHKLKRPQRAAHRGNDEAFDRATKSWKRLQRSLHYQRNAFKDLGWKVSTRSELSAERRANLEYLSLYRRPLPNKDNLADEVLKQASSGAMRLVDLAAKVPGGFVSAMPVILHLVWHHQLEININQRLFESSFVYLPYSPQQPMLAAA